MKNYVTANPLEFESYANECLTGHEGAVIHIAETPCVWVGLLSDMYNKAEIEARNLPVGQGQYYAGAIVNMPGDISVCITTWGPCDKGAGICQAVADILKERGVKVTFDVNDVLADGKKVASYCSVPQVSGWVQTVAHISIGKMDVELVKAICTKPMVKIPGALSDYDITAEDILPIIQTLLEAKDE